MKYAKLFDAFAQVDDRFIDRCLRKEKEALYKPEENQAPTRKSVRAKRILLTAVPLALTFAILLSATVFFAKRAKDQPMTDPGFKIGFDITSEGLSNGAKLAVKTEKSNLAVGEDLPVSVYCVCGQGKEYQQKNAVPMKATAKILMSYSRMESDENMETVREIADGTTPEYIWNGSFENMKCEQITVPATVFSKDDEASELATDSDGVVVWTLEVHKEYQDGSINTDRDSVAVYYRIEENCVYLTPTEETMELAEAAVQTLASKLVFMTEIYSYFPITISDIYEQNAKRVAPELTTLETKKDAAIAFIQLYENLLVQYRSCDLDHFYQVWSENAARMDEQLRWGEGYRPEFDDETERIFRLRMTCTTLEALLALDCYYNLLDEQMVQRMLDDFEEYRAINNASASKWLCVNPSHLSAVSQSVD